MHRGYRALLRNVSVYARARLVSPPYYNPRPRLVPLAALTRPRLRFYSAESPSHNNREVCKDAEDDDVVGNEELKMKIEDFYCGNQEAIPSIFEAILKRKLTGKHDEATDKMLMEEIHGGEMSDIDDDEVESDSDEFSDSDGDFDSDGDN